MFFTPPSTDPPMVDSVLSLIFIPSPRRTELPNSPSIFSGVFLSRRPPLPSPSLLQDRSQNSHRVEYASFYSPTTTTTPPMQSFDSVFLFLRHHYPPIVPRALDFQSPSHHPSSHNFFAFAFLFPPPPTTTPPPSLPPMTLFSSSFNPQASTPLPRTPPATHQLPLQAFFFFVKGEAKTAFSMQQRV